MINEANLMRKLAEDRASDALEVARKSLERSVREIEIYQSRLLHAETLEQKADIVNGAINFLVTGIYPNLRIDQLASAQAALKAQPLQA